MGRLRRRDQVTGAVGEGARPLAADGVLDAEVRLRVLELLGAHIGRHHPRKTLGQGHRGLSVAAPDVPHDIAPSDQSREPGIQLRGVGGAGLGVVGRVAGEMVS